MGFVKVRANIESRGMSAFLNPGLEYLEIQICSWRILGNLICVYTKKTTNVCESQKFYLSHDVAM